MNADLSSPQTNARPCRQTRLRRLACLLAAVTLLGVAPVASGYAASASGTSAPEAPQISDAAYTTTVSYVTTFSPLWFSYYQSSRSTANQLVGPDRVSPLYKTVVAVNDDTLYASSYLDLSADAAVLTLPSTDVTYSILVLDAYGNVLSTGLSKTPGVYALIGPASSLTNVPAGATPIQVSVSYPTIIFRADKYSSTGVNQIADAETFRRSLKLQSAAGYAGNPDGGAAQILPELTYAFPFKGVADGLIARDPMVFLRQLAVAVDSDRTPKMTSDETALAEQFDALLLAGTSYASLAAGARSAHQMILSNYLQHVDATNWIHFTDIGAWGSNVLNRASITEYLQYGNDIGAAAYYHVFVDGTGKPLKGQHLRGYTITFPAGSIPLVQRFWSITAYTPNAIELVPNDWDKYHVASYTPNLHYERDGSLTIHLAVSQPPGVPTANYLPVPPTAFNLLLRFYGPEPNTSVANDTYAPPPVIRAE